MNKALIERFRTKISNGCVFGPFMKTGDPAFVEAAGYAGVDFAILDMEHGPVSHQTMQNNIRAAQLSGMLPVIRVSKLDESEIGKALDIGAAAVQIPQITNAEEARKAVALARFAPEGERGVCRFVRAARYSMTERDIYFQEANDTLVIIQLEGGEAIRNIDEILAVPGVDIVFVGPYDLSASMGLIGQTSHPDVVAQMERIVRKAQERNIVLGVFADTPETMRQWLDAGVRYVSYSVDVGIFAASCRLLVNDFIKMSCRNG